MAGTPGGNRLGKGKFREVYEFKIETYAPLPSQRFFHGLKARFKGFSGPVGSGKSEALCIEALNNAVANPGCMGLLGAPTFQMLRDAAQAKLIEILERERLQFKYSKADNVIELIETQSKIVLRPLEEFERVRGMNLAWFGIDELTYVPEEAWERLEGRLREPGARHLCGFGVWTPKGHDWVWKRFKSGRFGGYELIEAQPLENKHLLNRVPDYYERLRNSYEPEFFKQEALGEYTVVGSNRVYSGFTRARNVRPVERNPRWELLWSLDFNWDPMCAVVAQRCGEVLEVLDEIVLPKATTLEACEEFFRRWGDDPAALQVYGDASGKAKQRQTGESDFTVVMRSVAQQGKKNARELVPSANPPVDDRVRVVNGKLLSASDDAGLVVDPKCQRLIADLERLTYKGDSRVIDKERDRDLSHLSDALGYVVWHEYGRDVTFGMQKNKLI